MSVRIDKYLWAVRIFKTRSMAADAIKGGKVKFDGDNVKPSKEVKIGEEYSIQLGELKKTIKVKTLLDNRVAAKLVPEFMEDLTPDEEYKSIDRLKEHRFVFRPRGLGRPSKKERRDIEEWFGDSEEDASPKN
ncbi:MAG: RNA-binding S4 domain-containing protein [Bacteroidia bacterium]